MEKVLVTADPREDEREEVVHDVAKYYLCIGHLPRLLISKRVFKCLVGLWTCYILVFYCLFRMAHIFI